jgi:hypothetical protein
VLPAPSAAVSLQDKNKGSLRLTVVVKASIKSEGAQENSKKIAEGFEEAGHAADQMPENAEEY